MPTRVAVWIDNLDGRQHGTSEHGVSAAGLIECHSEVIVLQLGVMKQLPLGIELGDIESRAEGQHCGGGVVSVERIEREADAGKEVIGMKLGKIFEDLLGFALLVALLIDGMQEVEKRREIWITRDEFLQLGDGPICAFAAGVLEIFHLLGRECRWRVRVERLVRSGDGEDLLFQSFRFGG